MAFRTWALAACALSVVGAAGCSLPRGTLGAGAGFDSGFPDTGRGGLDVGPPIDSGTPDDTGHDAGAILCTTSCDDGNPCTDDTCDATGTCAHTNNAATCDDSVFCNGADTCGAGTCSVHDGVSPCASPLTCDSTTDTCVGCAHNSDCPAPIDGAWSACDFGADLCTTTGGTQTRSVMTFTCHSGTCTAATTMAMQSCTRPSRDGIMCAAPSYTDWSTCTFGDPCTQMGTQARTATTSACAGGSCVATGADETQACTRMPTDGMPCGTVTTTPWSACMVGSTCATTGTQTRTTTTPTCTAGSCDVTSTSESQACSTGTATGALCGTTTCGSFGACVQTTPNSCDRRGTQTRSCMTPTCSSDMMSSCSASTPSTETQACQFNVSGVGCSVTNCGGCHEPGTFGCRSGHAGMRRCTTGTGTCMDWGAGPFCATGLGGTSMDVSCTCP